MSFTIHEATESEAPAIARVLASDQPSAFLKLQLGTVDHGTFTKDMTERVARAIRQPNQRWIVACDGSSGEIMSYAQWVLPFAVGEEGPEPTPEEAEKAAEEYRRGLVPEMNVSLMVELRAKLRVLRKSAMGKNRCYTLLNLGTLPQYRRRGAASALTSWPFTMADEEDIIVYLDTDEAGEGRRMYEKLGFQRVGEARFDLSEHGAHGAHTHIAMFRQPQEKSLGSRT